MWERGSDVCECEREEAGILHWGLLTVWSFPSCVWSCQDTEDTCACLNVFQDTWSEAHTLVGLVGSSFLCVGLNCCTMRLFYFLIWWILIDLINDIPKPIPAQESLCYWSLISALRMSHCQHATCHSRSIYIMKINRNYKYGYLGEDEKVDH